MLFGSSWPTPPPLRFLKRRTRRLFSNLALTPPFAARRRDPLSCLGRSTGDRSGGPDSEPSWYGAYPLLAHEALSRSGCVPELDWRTDPGPAVVSPGDQRSIRPRRTSASKCELRSEARTPSRSRRSSSMRARIAAKSSAARGRFTSPPPSVRLRFGGHTDRLSGRWCCAKTIVLGPILRSKLSALRSAE